MTTTDSANNGAAGPATIAESSGLAGALRAHAQALVKASTAPNGMMMQINPLQMFVDLELANVRIAVLFEALVETHAIDPAALTVKLRDKLLGEVKQLEEDAAQKILIARGKVPRNEQRGG